MIREGREGREKRIVAVSELMPVARVANPRYNMHVAHRSKVYHYQKRCRNSCNATA